MWIVVAVCLVRYEIGFVLAKMTQRFLRPWAERGGRDGRESELACRHSFMVFLRQMDRRRNDDSVIGEERTSPYGYLRVLRRTYQASARLRNSIESINQGQDDD